MKFTFLLLVLVVACSKPSGSSKKSVGPDPIQLPEVVDIVDPLVTPDQQQQTDTEFELNRNYNGVNVVLNHHSSRHLGMIRIKDKDADKLNKHMALSLIKVDSPHVKNDLEAKVGKHILCRPDTCWAYIDYKNGDLVENTRTSEKAKAATLGLNYRGETLHLARIVTGLFKTYSKGTIKISGQDAKALYSVMSLTEVEAGGKGAVRSRKTGSAIVCTRTLLDAPDAKAEYECEVEFNFRSGSLKEGV